MIESKLRKSTRIDKLIKQLTSDMSPKEELGLILEIITLEEMNKFDDRGQRIVNFDRLDRLKRASFALKEL